MTVATGFQLPEYIEPAVIPYMNCLSDSEGVAVRRASRNGPLLPRLVEKGGDCTPFRNTAARNADKLLRVRGVTSRGKRQAYIEKSLADIDANQVKAR